MPRLRRRHAGRRAAGGAGRPFGPRLLAAVALRTGGYRLSKRQVQAAMAGLLGLGTSTSKIAEAEQRAAEATATPVQEVRAAIRDAPALCVDETEWREGRERDWLRGRSAPRRRPSASTARAGPTRCTLLVGEPIGPVIVSDRSRPPPAPRTDRFAGPICAEISDR